MQMFPGSRKCLKKLTLFHEPRTAFKHFGELINASSCLKRPKCLRPSHKRKVATAYFALHHSRIIEANGCAGASSHRCRGFIFLREGRHACGRLCCHARCEEWARLQRLLLVFHTMRQCASPAPLLRIRKVNGALSTSMGSTSIRKAGRVSIHTRSISSIFGF